MKLKSKRIIIAAVVLLVIGGALYYFVFQKSDTNKTTYQTGTVEKGTLVQSVTASGTVTSINRISVTTSLSGTLAEIYVANGDTVTEGQKIMRIDLDEDGQLAETKAESDVQSAEDAVKTAQRAVTTAEQNKITLHRELVNAQNNTATAKEDYDNADEQAAKDKEALYRALLMAKNNTAIAKEEYDQAVDDDLADTMITSKLLAYQAAQAAQESAQDDYDNADVTGAKMIAAKKQAYETAVDAQTVAQQKYDAADASIEQARQGVTRAETNLSAAKQAYWQTSGTITAPVAGQVGDILLTIGQDISSASSSSTTSGASGGTKIATITTDILPTGTFTLAEVDVPKVKEGQKGTITLDAITDKTFTGTVIGVDRSGSVSSGVTSYSMVVQFDSISDEVLPNMSGSVAVITATKTDVLLVPSSAVKTSNDVSTVMVMNNGVPESITVEVGDSNDSQTEIVSGLTDGQTVITATITTGSTDSDRATNSAFGTSTIRMQGGGTIQSSGPPAGF